MYTCQCGLDVRKESDCLRCLGGMLDFGGGNIFPSKMSLMCCTIRLIATIYGNTTMGNPVMSQQGKVPYHDFQPLEE